MAMLIIRDSQMAALAEADIRRFARETTRAVEARWPAAYARLGEAGVEASIRAAITRCARYGIDEPEDVAAFVEVMYALDDHDFDRGRPWAVKILLDPFMDGALKCRELEEQLARELSPREEEEPEDEPIDAEDDDA